MAECTASTEVRPDRTPSRSTRSLVGRPRGLPDGEQGHHPRPLRGRPGRGCARRSPGGSRARPARPARPWPWPTGRARRGPRPARPGRGHLGDVDQLRGHHGGILPSAPAAGGRARSARRLGTGAPITVAGVAEGTGRTTIDELGDEPSPTARWRAARGGGPGDWPRWAPGRRPGGRRRRPARPGPTPPAPDRTPAPGVVPGRRAGGPLGLGRRRRLLLLAARRTRASRRPPECLPHRRAGPGRRPAGPAPTVWDSGRVASAAQAFVPYAGPALATDAAYRWTVQTWDGAGRPGPVVVAGRLRDRAGQPRTGGPRGSGAPRTRRPSPTSTPTPGRSSRCAGAGSTGPGPTCRATSSTSSTSTGCGPARARPTAIPTPCTTRRWT